MDFSTKLVLFDAAGTLIEPAEPVQKIYREHFARCGWRAAESEIGASFVEAFAGMGDPDFSLSEGDSAEKAWWRQIVERIAASVGIDVKHTGFEGCFEGLFAHYANGSAWRVYPEVGEVLARLRSKGVKMAVVSNFDRRLHRVLAELGLAEMFDLILTSADVRSRKPSPLLLEEAIRRLSVPVVSTCLVGDGQREDGGAAAAAGVRSFILERPMTSLRDFMKWVDEDFLEK